MAIEGHFSLFFTNFSQDGGSFLTVLSLLNCGLLCTKNSACSSFFYSHTMRSCALCSTIYQNTSGLAPQTGIKYYRMTHAYPRGGDPYTGGRLKPAALVTVHSRGRKHPGNTTSRLRKENMKTEELKTTVLPKLCTEEPTYVNQGAVRKQKFSKPGYPVVIEYECEKTGKERYKYLSGSREALCDEQGNWTLPAMFCIPTSCYINVVDNFGTRTAQYGGDLNKTREGVECQAWTENKPHSFSLVNKLNGACTGCDSMKETGNKCRLVGDVEKSPWCYTMDSTVRWGYCDVPECTMERICAHPPFLPGASSIKTIVIGQKVHVTYRCRADLKYIAGGNVSVCDMETGAWQWPNLICGSESCFYFDKEQWQKILYFGKVSTTKTGKTCQRWDSQTPHKHPDKPSMFPGASSLSELGNMCRDSNTGGPWCYTMDSDKRWEFCDVPECTLNL